MDSGFTSLRDRWSITTLLLGIRCLLEVYLWLCLEQFNVLFPVQSLPVDRLCDATGQRYHVCLKGCVFSARDIWLRSYCEWCLASPDIYFPVRFVSLPYPLLWHFITCCVIPMIGFSANMSSLTCYSRSHSYCAEFYIAVSEFTAVHRHCHTWLMNLAYHYIGLMHRLYFCYALLSCHFTEVTYNSTGSRMVGEKHNWCQNKECLAQNLQYNLI